jgi:hypothetical protein
LSPFLPFFALFVAFSATGLFFYSSPVSLTTGFTFLSSPSTSGYSVASTVELSSPFCLVSNLSGYDLLSFLVFYFFLLSF